MIRPVIYLACGVLVAAFFTTSSPCAAQAPAADRALQDQSIREAMQLSRLRKAPAQNGTSLSPEELKMIDREFGTQSVTGVVFDREEWLLMMEANGFFTSNATLSNTTEISDWVGRPGLRGAWMPKLNDHWSVLAMSNYSLWRYAHSKPLDFDDFGGQLGLQYQQGQGQVPGGLPTLSSWLQYRYQRLFSPGNWGSSIYETHFIETGLRKAWKLSPSVGAWLGANAAVSVAGLSDAFRRHEFSLQAGSIWQITPKASLTALYRAAWFNVVKTKRDDLNQTFLLGLSYQLTSKVKADLFMNSVFNQSDVDAFDYDVFNVGMGAALVLTW
jgi:hypothetical protein